MRAFPVIERIIQWILLQSILLKTAKQSKFSFYYNRLLYQTQNKNPFPATYKPEMDVQFIIVYNNLQFLSI